MDFPRIIWFLWLQGKDKMPVVVKKCYKSWVRHNPGWKLVFLDRGNIEDFIQVSSHNLSPQAFSDLIRINLLAKYGGVWSDASCFCNKPLDSWLFDYLKTGFFAFEKPGPDRMISSWFIAADKDNYITQTYCKAVNDYINENSKLTLFNNSKLYTFRELINVFGTQIWFNRTFIYLFKVYPYFWFHYLFEKLYSDDELFKKLWDDTLKLSAIPPHLIQLAGSSNSLTIAIKTEIDHANTQVYKLDWKNNQGDIQKGSVLDYLFSKACYFSSGT